MGRPRRRRWRRGLWRVTVGVLSVGAVGVWGGAYFFLRPATEPSAVTPTVVPSPVVTVEADEPLPVFARAGEVDLGLVSAKVLAIAFHEASMSESRALRPTGICVICKNHHKFEPPPAEDPDIEYIVMDPRGRAGDATSAVDLVMPRGGTVLAPVSGTVVSVTRYRLYYEHPDVRVEIRPTGAPDRRVVVIHLEHVKLVKGQKVEASVTVLGTVRRFPFESQVDRYVRGTYPHVHMEVKEPAPRGAKKRSKDGA